MPEEIAESNKFRVLFMDTVDPSDIVRMESYATLAEAVTVGNSAQAPHLVLQAVDTGSGQHRWQVLPYGSARFWRTTKTLWDQRWALGMAVLTTGVFSLILFGGEEKSRA